MLLSPSPSVVIEIKKKEKKKKTKNWSNLTTAEHVDKLKCTAW